MSEARTATSDMQIGKMHHLMSNGQSTLILKKIHVNLGFWKT
jgi:hypothetical protein